MIYDVYGMRWVKVWSLEFRVWSKIKIWGGGTLNLKLDPKNLFRRIKDK